MLAMGALIGASKGNPFAFFLMIGAVLLWYRTWYKKPENKDM